MADVATQQACLTRGMGATPTKAVSESATRNLPKRPDDRRGVTADAARVTYITLVVHEAEACRDALIAGRRSNSMRLMRLADRASSRGCVTARELDRDSPIRATSGELPNIDRIADNWD